MRGYLLVAAVTAAAALTGLVPADGVRAGAAAPGTRAVPGTQLWVARFPAGGQELSSAMVVSPDGRRVFVTGVGWGGRVTGDDSETAAYSAATGRRLWFSRYRGPGRLAEEPSAVAVSPGGGTVFVTGDSHGPSGASDYATVAYSAATGRRLWVSRYKGPVNGPGGASAVAASPGGGIVFVTGLSPGRGNGFVYDYATVAYSAAAGRQLWVRRYSGPVKGPDIATAVAVSPGGGTVFVTGGSPVRGNGTEDYATVAYDAATGRQLWVRRYSGPVKGPDAATAVAVSPGGAAVFVTGRSRGRGNGIEDYATVAYDAATGRQLWASRYQNGGAASLAVSPGGATVYVTGTGEGYATVAYSAATGRQLWARRYHGGYQASSVAVSPGGATVYVTGSGTASGYATVAYSAAAGRQLWARRYNAPVTNSAACCVAVSPAGTTVYVTGWTETRTSYDYATIAYRG